MNKTVHLIVVIGFLAIHLPVVASAFDDWFSAVARDDGRAITTLLLRGFDANTVNEKGETALLIAARAEASEAVKTILLAPGLNPDARNASQETPLMMAALKGNLSLAKTLVARGADVNKTGWTPLHYAATGGHVELLKFLLEHHAYIDAESPNKSTPLMMAAMYGSPEAVKLLLDEGADWRLKNDLGLSALDFAGQGQRPDAQKLLAALANNGGAAPLPARAQGSSVVPTPVPVTNPERPGNAAAGRASNAVPASAAASAPAKLPSGSW